MKLSIFMKAKPRKNLSHIHMYISVYLRVWRQKQIRLNNLGRFIWKIFSFEPDQLIFNFVCIDVPPSYLYLHIYFLPKFYPPLHMYMDQIAIYLIYIQYMYQCIYLFMHQCVSKTFYLSIYLSHYLYVYLLIYLSIHTWANYTGFVRRAGVGVARITRTIVHLQVKRPLFHLLDK